MKNAISSYNAQTSKEYNFKMPIIKGEDWEQIYRNISVVSFLQGIPAGLRTYNNYAVVTSTGNKEYVDPNAIYFVSREDGNYVGEYHLLTCNKLNSNNIIGYKKSDYNSYRKYYNSKDYYYKFSSNRNNPEQTYIQACYYCIIDSTSSTNSDVESIKKAYDTALARERYNLIKTTQNFN